MKTRAELKEIAKKGFTANYWPIVGAYCVLVLLIGAINLVPVIYQSNYYDPSLLMDGAIRSIPFTGSILYLLIGVPLTVGYYYYFLLVSKRKKVEFTTPFKLSFSNNYPKYLGGSLWMSLWIFLWTLLFVIPGIIKSYSYAMTTYILSDCPEVSATDALKLSKRIMDGHKFELFVLQLSFIGWVLLSCLGLFIPMFLYVGPYMQATYAAFYDNLLELSLEKGIVSKDEIGTRLSSTVDEAA